MTSKSEEVNEASLGSEQAGLVFYDLTTSRGSSNMFSPHTPKTLLDLKLLGIGAERRSLTFIQVRKDLAAKVSETVTVPTLELSDGSYVTDSWDIAEYLERSHPKGHQIFGGTTAGKSLAAFINHWTMHSLLEHYTWLYRTSLTQYLDDESREYYINVKWGAADFAKADAGCSDPDTVAEHIKKLADKLRTIDVLLASSPAAGDTTNARSGERWLAGTEHPSHADFCLFGWYVFSRIGGAERSDAAWRANPRVATWVDSMRAWAGDEICADFLS